ncbi:MAG: molecular chaperone HtpG [Saprospiraceae bacterium]|nr:molecular chaperone HtpG [Saprospiraceae bacterium]
MQTGTISVQTENIFPIIKKFLYSEQEIFLRELISNAVDATSKLKTLASKGEFKGELGDLTIHVDLDKEAKTLTIRDSGIGMTEAEVQKYLNQVAFSSAADFLKKHKDDTNIIGHFGLGFYSAFMVADRVEVITKSYKKSKAAHWTCDGSPEYTLDTHERKERGTDVVLHLSDDAQEYLESARIESMLKKYCKFLPVPIQFGMKTETRFEGEGDDRTEIKEEVPNIINNTDPAWKRKPSKLKDEDYKEFYRELYPFSTPPLFWIHLNIDYPFNLTGILYFPKVGNQFEMQKNKIQLYSNQVYVTDDVSEIVPEFLTLLHGVIDSPDIPLNVSRSYLQSDANVRKITSYISKKVAEKLNNLYKKKQDEYIEKWNDIGVFVKYGMISDEKFHDRAMKFALIKNVDGDHLDIEAYKEKVKANQTDKYDKVVIIYAQNAEEQTSYINAAREKGYDVALFDQIIDNHFIQHLEYKLGDVTFVRVDSDVADNLVQKDEDVESVLSEKEQERVKALFETALGDDGNSVQLKPMAPSVHPVVITKPEFMRRMKEMQALQGMDVHGMPESYNVVINTNHPLVAEKLVNMRSAEKKEKFANYLYNLARLNQNMLKGEELNEFIEESIEFLK